MLSGTLIGVLALGATLLIAVSWKWCLPRVVATLICALAVAAGVAAGLWMDAAALPPPATFTLTVAIQLVVYLSALAYRFYRDPDCVPPSDPSAGVFAGGWKSHLRSQDRAGQPSAVKQARVAPRPGRIDPDTPGRSRTLADRDFHGLHRRSREPCSDCWPGSTFPASTRTISFPARAQRPST